MNILNSIITDLDFDNPVAVEQYDAVLFEALITKIAEIPHLMSYQIDEYHGIPVMLGNNVVLKQAFTSECSAIIGRHHSTHQVIITVNDAWVNSPDEVKKGILESCYAFVALDLLDSPVPLDDDNVEAIMQARTHASDDWVVAQGIDWASGLAYLANLKNLSALKQDYAMRALRLRGELAL